MATSAQVRPRLASPSLPTGSSTPLAAASPQPAPRSGRPRVYWGDRVGVLFWTACFALLGGMILVEAILSLLSLFR